MAKWSPLDPTRVDLTDLDLNAIAGRATELARDATYVTVGLGVLGFQRAQVRRREIERRLRR